MNKTSTWLAGAVLGLCACAPLSALERDEARHLLSRTGFGGTPAEIEALVPLTREQAVDGLIASTHTTTRTKPPAFCTEDDLPAYLTKVHKEYAEADAMAYNKSDEKARAEGEAKRRMLGDRKDKWGRELKEWWLKEMVVTDSPLTEHIVLLWSNHFTSSLRAIEEPRLMYEQNITLRKDGLENFGLLLHDINADPAMFNYLDSNSNVAGRPNENYAREVMELFTLGEGQKYTESDIREAARALSGYKVDPATGHAEIDKNRHDNGRKVILGEKGNFNGDDVIRLLLLSEERVAINIAEKFWRDFVNAELDNKEVYKLAATFYRSHYDIKKLLRAVLLTDKFWDQANRGSLVKSPAEYVVGAVRLLQLPSDDCRPYVELCAKLGQDLCDPPNVKGWSTYTSWLTSETLLTRWEIADQFAGGKVGSGKDPGSMMGGPEMAGPAKADAGDKKEPAKKDEPKASLPMVAKPWIADARAKGADGAAIATFMLLPLQPADTLGKADFDTALRQILHDSAFNLK